MNPESELNKIEADQQKSEDSNSSSEERKLSARKVTVERFADNEAKEEGEEV